MQKHWSATMRGEEAEVLFHECSGNRVLVVCDSSGNAEVVVCDSSAGEGACRCSSAAEEAACSRSSTEGERCDRRGNADASPRGRSPSRDGDVVSVSARVPQDSAGETRQGKRSPADRWRVHEVAVDDGGIADNDEAADPGVPEDLAGGSDDCSIPSLSPAGSRTEEDLIPDVDVPEDLPLPAPATQKAIDKDTADSALAWGVLAALLGSPAPSCVAGKRTKNDSISFCEHGDETGVVPEIDGRGSVVRDRGDESDSLGTPSMDMPELEGSHEDGRSKNCVGRNDGYKVAADSALAFQDRVGMLLGSPAPKAARTKNTKPSGGAAKNLRSERTAMEGDAFDPAPSLHLDGDAVDAVASPRSEANTKPAAAAGRAELSDVSTEPAVATAAARKILSARYGAWIRTCSDRDLQAVLRLSLFRKAVSEGAYASAVAVSAAEIAAAQAENALVAAMVVTHGPSTAASAHQNFAVATKTLRSATAAMTEANDAVRSLVASTKAAAADTEAARNESENDHEEFRQRRLRRALRMQSLARGKLLAATKAVMAADGVLAQDNSTAPGSQCKRACNDLVKPESSAGLPRPRDESVCTTRATDGTTASASEPRAAEATSTTLTAMRAEAEVVQTPEVSVMKARTNGQEEHGIIENDGLDSMPSIIGLDDERANNISPLSEDLRCEHTIPDVEESVPANALDASLKRDSATKEAADSAIAWTALMALLGAPAPSSVARKKGKRGKDSVSNLWDASGNDLDEILLFGRDDGSRQDGNEVEEEGIHQAGREGAPIGRDGPYDVGDAQCFPTVPTLSKTLDEDVNGVEQECHDGSSLAQKMVRQDTPSTNDDTHSTPGIIENDGLDTMLSIIGLEGEGVNNTSRLSGDPHCEHTIPDVEESVPGNALDVSLKSVSTTKEVADSAIAWTALAALLGAPVPSSVASKKGKRGKGSVSNLWDAAGNDLDEILLFGRDDVSQQDSNGANEEDVHQAGREDAPIEGDERYDAGNAQGIPTVLTLSATFGEDVNGIEQECQGGPSLDQKMVWQDIPSINDDTHSIPSLSGTSNDGDEDNSFN